MPVQTENSWKLYLDLQVTQGPQNLERGITRFCIEHARELLKRPGLVSGVGLSPLLPFPSGLPQELASSPHLQWATAANFRRASRKGPIAYHLMTPFLLSHFESLLPPFVSSREAPLIVTLVDLIPFTRPDAYFSKPDVARRCRIRLELFRQADLVLAISENTRREAIELLGLDPSRLVTIGSGVSSYFRIAQPFENPSVELRRNLPEIQRPFVLYVTGTPERKNTARLIEAYAMLPSSLRSNLQLVLACRLDDQSAFEWTAHAEAAGLKKEEVVLTGFVPDSVLRTLYQVAELLVFPSLYEGFGLPVAEAAACGCPAIVSNCSSMPEILDFAEATFDPTNSAAIAFLMEKALVETDFRAELKAKAAACALKNTWEAVAEKTAAGLARLPSVVASRKGASSGARVAFVGAPCEVGAASPRLKLVEELAKEWPVDLFGLSSAGADVLSQVPRARSFAVEAFDRHFNPAGYDAIVYLLGPPGADDSYTRQLGVVYPGILWPSFPARTYDALERLEVGSRLVQSSKGVFVTSEDERRILLLAQGPCARTPPIKVISTASEMRDFIGDLAAL